MHGAPRVDNGSRIIVTDQSVATATETESMLSSLRRDGGGEDLFDDTESSITSVSQIAMGGWTRDEPLRPKIFFLFSCSVDWQI